MVENDRIQIGQDMQDIGQRKSEEFGDRNKCVLSDMREYIECEWRLAA